MFPSSIFNSNLRWLRDLDKRAPLLALALLALVEFGIARSDRMWRRAPDTMMGAFNAIEQDVISHAPAPTLLFVGSSRMRDAVSPRQLERALGLPRGGVLNLAFTGGTPFEALLLYRRHRSMLRHARVLTIGIEDWYWNDGFPPSQVEQEFSDLHTRWGWFERRHRLEDLVGGIWRTSELQDPIMRWGISFIRGVHNQLIVEDRVTWRTPAQVREVGPERIDPVPTIEDLMQAYRSGPAYEQYLRDLITLANEDHVAVVLTQVPLRGEYLDALERRYPQAQPYMRERVAAIAHDSSIQVRLFSRGTEVGIPDDRFYDYGHLTEDGCRRMVLNWVSILRPFLDSRATPAVPETPQI